MIYENILLNDTCKVCSRTLKSDSKSTDPTPLFSAHPHYYGNSTIMLLW